jgi:molybdopterin-guanine dinucleotide biosynthesis protein A
MSASDPILCVLAGGEGRRFGQPKAHATLRGEPAIARLIHRLGRAGGWRWRPWLSLPARGDAPLAAVMAERCVHDPQQACGPLWGMAAVLRAAGGHDRVLFLAVDMPLIDEALVIELVAALRRSPALAGVMGRWGDGPRAGAAEPWPSLWRAGPALRVVGRALEQGVAGPSRLLDRPGVAALPLHGACHRRVYGGFNSAAEHAAIEACLARGGSQLGPMLP